MAMFYLYMEEAHRLESLLLELNRHALIAGRSEIGTVLADIAASLTVKLKPWNAEFYQSWTPDEQQCAHAKIEALLAHVGMTEARLRREGDFLMLMQELRGD